MEEGLAYRVLKNLLDDNMAEIGALPFCARDILGDSRFIHIPFLPRKASG
jgi:hypothetical protein